MNTSETNNYTNGNIIHADKVRKIFGDQVAIDSMDLHVPRGSIFGFIGPSGSGKTTTLRLLTGVHLPTSGEITVLGKRPADFKQSDREKIGYLIQHFVLYPELTVWENLNFVASFYGVGLFRRSRLKKLLEFVELAGDEGKLAGNLSGGMQRRLSLAATLVHNPELIFLDEPTAGIDPLLRRKFWDYFKELQQEGRTLFVTTQYVGEAAYCDIVGIMHEGRLLMAETPERLRRRAFGGDVVGLKTAEAIRYDHRHGLEDLPFSKGHVKMLTDQEIEMIVDEASTAIPAVIEWCQGHGLTVETIEPKHPPFDDVFVRIIEQETARREEVSNV